MQRQYWQFYWPLSLTGLAMLVTRQFQNGALARYPAASRELALFALASGTFFLFNAPLIFIPQMANVFVRSRRARQVCLRFTVGVCLALSAPVAVLAFSPAGKLALGAAFEVKGPALDQVVLYLRYLLPLVVINGLRYHYMGLLIQVKRTGWVTLLNVLSMLMVVGLLVVGFQVGWPAVRTVGLSQLIAAVVTLALAVRLEARYFRLPAEAEHQDLTYREALAFFWPVALTSTMFALSRPILYSFVSRTADSEPTLAALRVTFDFTMIFHAPLNQFRHLFVTFGCGDLPGIRRFMARVMLTATGIMVLVAATPVSTMFFHDLLGVEGKVLALTQRMIWVLCLVPLVVSLRNYFHGLALASRSTGSMGAGGVFRNVAIYLAAWGLQTSGLLAPRSAAAILVLGFLAETVIVVLFRVAGSRRPADARPLAGGTGAGEPR